MPKLAVSHDYFLAGKVLCGHCGCRLTPKSTNHPNRKKPYTPYYECYRLSKYRGYPCEVKRINAEALENLFLQTLDNLAWDEDLIAQVVEAQTSAGPGNEELMAQGEMLRSRLHEIEGKISNIVKALEEGLTSNSVQTRLQELERQRPVLQAEIAQVKSNIEQTKAEPIDVSEAMNLFRRCSELFPVMTLDEKEALVDAILKGATVDKDKVVEFELYVGEDTSNVVQNVKIGSPTWTRTLEDS